MNKIAMLLDWQPFTPLNRPPKSTCFFSDGVAIYHAGWYSTDEGVCIYLRGETCNFRMSDEEFARVRFWAHPGNFISNTGVVRGDVILYGRFQ